MTKGTKGQVNVSASTAKKTRSANLSESTTTDGLIAKEAGTLTVPIRDDLTAVESIVCGFRQNMLEVGEGSVATGAGLGNDFITLEWGDRTAVLRGSEILKAWVKTFAPEDAERFPEEVR